MPRLSLRLLIHRTTGIRLNAGLVFLSDSRTNAGLDHIASFRKMYIFSQDGDRVIVTEWRFPPGSHTGWHRHNHDYVVVPITTGELHIFDGKATVPAPLRAGDLIGEPGDLVLSGGFVLGREGGLRRVLFESGALLLEGVDLLPEIVDLFLIQRALVADDLGREAEAGKIRGDGTGEILATEINGDSRALLAAGRIEDALAAAHAAGTDVPDTGIALRRRRLALLLQGRGRRRGVLSAHRARVHLGHAAGAEPAEVEKMVLDDPEISRRLEGLTIRKVIVVKDRIVNIVAG